MVKYYRARPGGRGSLSAPAIPAAKEAGQLQSLAEK